MTMAQEYNIAQHHVETPNNYCQPELITRDGMREGSVVEDAVERNSWGKSRCELMCRFPNTGDFTAHLEVHPLKHLLYGTRN